MSSWIPNLYKQEGQEKGYENAFLNALVQKGGEITSSGLPIIFTLGHLSEITGVDYKLVYSMVTRKIKTYKSFRIHKRSGGYRQINVPFLPLNKIQYFIAHHILQNARIHNCSTAYSKGCSPLKNAQRHCGAKWLINTDILRFFESVSERQVYHAFIQMGYSKLVAFQLGRLTTITGAHPKKYHSKRWIANTDKYHFLKHKNVGHLPQGASTSPMLANIVCYRLDEILFELAQKYSCAYTRYADDISFSTNIFSRSKAQKLINEVSKELSLFGFKTNHKKTIVIPPGARKIVTGLIVDGEAPKIRKEIRDRIENHLYFSKEKSPMKNCKATGFRSLVGFYKHLYGLINYVRQIDIDLGNKYLKKFNELEWSKFVKQLAVD